MKRALTVALAVAVAFGFAIGMTASAARANVVLTQLSSDPFTNPTSQHATEVEPDTFAFGSTIVAAFQQGRFVSGGGASGIGWATSTDAGASWVHGSLPGITTFAGDGPYDRATDPVVAYDAKHGAWLVASLGKHQATGTWDVLVSRSADGLAWGPPVTVALNPAHGSLDKPWVVCDDWSTSSFYGHCYVQWTDFVGACSQHVQLSTSTDGGLTWGAVETPANTASATGGQPVVQPNGTVIVPITGGCNQNSLLVFGSVDGGASWSAIRHVTPIRRHVVAGGLRGGKYVLPSAEVDGTGRVYVAWQDCRFRRNCRSNDIVFSTSTDGVNWSAVRRIPIDPVGSTVDHFIPGLAVDRSTSGAGAHLGVAYHFYPQTDCDVSTCQLDVGFVASTDAGATWGAPTQLAGPMRLSWLANAGGAMVGDYISTSFASDGKAYPVIEVANAPSGGLFDEATYTPAGGLEAVGGSAVASASGVVFTGQTPPPQPPPTQPPTQ
jgi:hypothetical protein